jgi:predicted DNA repair protein MutK
MASGLLALLDDVVALAKVAAASLDDAASQAVKVTGKAAGVVIDDTAVTPRYVIGFAAERELPIVGRIALGSLKNKMLFLLPAALLLYALAEWAIIPLLMMGALFLCIEGYEKIHQAVAPHGKHASAVRAGPHVDAKALEEQTVASAIRTDFILSAEIMAIALATVTSPNLMTRAFVLASVAILVTAGVYGLVAIIVKADDFGVYLAQREEKISRAIGQFTVYSMPPFLKILSFVGTLAMLWVGGGIVIHGLSEYGIKWPEGLVHLVSEVAPSGIPFIGGAFAWFLGAVVSTVFGLLVGAITMFAVVTLLTPLCRAFRPT